MRTYYHATPSRNIRRILRQGLRSSKDTGILPEWGEISNRIYVTTDLTRAEYIAYLSQEGLEPWTILRVDTQERARKDPDSWTEGLGYLTQAIPPERITVLGKYSRTKKEAKVYFRKELMGKPYEPLEELLVGTGELEEPRLVIGEEVNE